MSTYHHLDAEDAHRVASRLESAAKSANDAADRIESALHQLRQLTEHGYGNNVCALLEELSALRTRVETSTTADQAGKGQK